MLARVLAARWFGSVQDWYKFGRVLTDSVIRRKHTKYALLLGKLLYLEAERSKNIEELWMNFGFLLQKLRFSKAVLRLGLEKRQWEASEHRALDIKERAIIQNRDGNSLEMTLYCESGQWDEDTHRLLSELAAEAWSKAFERWQQLHRAPR
jgi:hypothetical protein